MSRRGKHECAICGKDVTNWKDDYTLRLVRTEPFGSPRGFSDSHHYAKIVLHLCEPCSDRAVALMREAVRDGS